MKFNTLVLLLLMVGSAFSHALQAQCAPTFDVKLGYTLDLVNKKFATYLVASENMSGPLCNFFSSGSQVAVRWPAVSGSNPVTGITFTAGVPQWQKDPLAGNPTGDDGGDGFYYALFNMTTATSQNLTVSPNLELFSFDYTSTTDPAFEFVNAGTVIPAFTGTYVLDPAMLFGFANKLSGFIAPGAFPVEYTHFDAKAVSATDVELSWGTAMELNNDFFEIQKSTDGISFKDIGRVEGKGTTTEAQTYTFLDKDYVADRVYYRLRQIDVDGGFDFSDVREVRLDQAGFTQLEFEVAPNPATEFVTFRLIGSSEGNYSLNVIDAFGKQVLNETFDLSNGQYKMQVDNLAEGMYYATLTSTNGSQYSVGKFLKK